VGSSFGLEYLFAKFPIPTNLLFMGLIVGGLPAIWKNVKGSKIKAGHIIAFLLFFVVVAGLAIMGESEGKAADLTFNAINVIKLLGVGVVASATMVIPGVSGSMMLMLMGYYNPVLETITDFIRALVSFDMKGILQGCTVLIPFGIGIVVGIFAIAKLVEIIFEKFPLYAYWAIIGLIVASPVAIVAMGDFSAFGLVNALVGIVTFIIGFGIARKLGD